MTKKSSSLSDEDFASFREAMKDVVPLKSQNKIFFEKQKTRFEFKKEEKISILEKPKIIESEKQVGSEAILSFRRPGIQHAVFKKLKQGFFKIEASLDLHGFYVDDVEAEINRFLSYCIENQFYCVSIIHGKGKKNPILKNKVNNVLRGYQAVLAFHSAPPRQGGAGAVNVILRRGR